MFSVTDSLSVAASSVVGLAAGAPPERAILSSVLLQIAIKVLEKAPSIIRALKARRTARKAAKYAK